MSMSFTDIFITIFVFPLNLTSARKLLLDVIQLLLEIRTQLYSHFLFFLLFLV